MMMVILILATVNRSEVDGHAYTLCVFKDDLKPRTLGGLIPGRLMLGCLIVGDLIVGGLMMCFASNFVCVNFVMWLE